MRIKFDKDPLAVKQKNYLTKIVNDYISYELNGWLRNPTNNFKFQNWLFGASNVIKNCDKEKFVYTGYGMTFESAGLWSFDNDTARNVIIFDVGNNSSLHSYNCKNDFLVLGEGPPFGVNERFGAPENNFDISFSKGNTQFC